MILIDVEYVVSGGGVGGKRDGYIADMYSSSGKFSLNRGAWIDQNEMFGDKIIAGQFALISPTN